MVPIRAVGTMRHMGRLPDQSPWALATFSALAWLAGLAAINVFVLDDPVRSILPYGLPVVWAACQRLVSGFVVAGMAALSALAGGAIPSPAADSVAMEGLFAYLKLSLVAIVAWAISRMMRSSRSSSA